MALLIDRTNLAAGSVSVNVNLFNPVVSKYGGGSIVPASSNTLIWTAPGVSGVRQAGILFAYCPTSSANSFTGTPGVAASYITWGDSGSVTAASFGTGGSISISIASSTTINVNNLSTTNGRPIYWSYFGLL